MRCLIVGCGCRGRMLARGLMAEGHTARGTSRDPARRSALAAQGGEPVEGDPDRIGTLIAALAHVSVVYLLLGSATGEPEAVAALHGERLSMLLQKLIDTTVRAVVYEAAGSVDAEVLRGGAQLVRAACERSRIPYALLETDPADRQRWLSEALGASAILNT